MTLRSIRRVQHGSVAVLSAVILAGLVALGRFAPSTGQPQAPTGSGAGGGYALAAGSTLLCISNTSHWPGAKGTNWRTDVEVHNPGSVQASYTFALLKKDTDNSNAAKASFTLAPGLSQRYTDIIDTVFHFAGSAALQISVTSGTVLVTSDTYNRLAPGNPGSFPDGSTFGQFVPAMTSDQAITTSDQGRLIQLTHDPTGGSSFRTNIGFVNGTTAQTGVTVDLYTSAGVWLGPTIPVTLRPLDFQQLDKVFERVTNQVVSDGYAIVRTATPGGSFFAYASLVDNRTGDPICIPAQKLPAGTTSPTPTPTATAPTGPVITGPGGTSVTLPGGGTTPNASVTLTAGNGSNLAKSGETLVSTVIQVNVGGEGVSTGAGPFIVKIPVTGTVSDPAKVELKVQTNVGPVYPVSGVYDAGSKVFSAEVEQLWNGWTMGVVVNANLTTIEPQPAPAAAVHALGWTTPPNWETCYFRAAIDTASTAAVQSFARNVQAQLFAACATLVNGQFHSPKLWLDRRTSPAARVVHIVSGTEDADPTTAWGADQGVNENTAAFSIMGYNDEQMHALGRLYFNITQVVPYQWPVPDVAIHELLHGVQRGYDIRDLSWQSPHGTWHGALKWLCEGNSTPVGTTYNAGGGIYGGNVYVRASKGPERLDEIVQADQVGFYERQDLFAYIAKKYAGGSFADLAMLYQVMSDQTNGKFGLGPDDYRALYRTAMDMHYLGQFGVSLSDLYTGFAVDRAYVHPDAAVLRDADKALAKNSLDRTLFGSLTGWDTATQASVTSGVDGGFASGLLPLQTWAITAPIPAWAQTTGSLGLVAQVTGAPLGHQGVRIFIFVEKNNVMLQGGEIEVAALSAPVIIPASADTQTMTILVVNGSVANTPAQVTIGMTAAQTVLQLIVPEKPQGWGCGAWDDGFSVNIAPTWSSGTAFQYIHSESHVSSGGDTFSSDVSLTGTVSGDDRTLTSLQVSYHFRDAYPNTGNCSNGSCDTEEWFTATLADVPAAADSTASLYHFHVEGAAALAVVTAWYNRQVFENEDCIYDLDPTLPQYAKIDIRFAGPGQTGH